MRKNFLILSLLVILSMILAACAPAPAATEPPAPVATEPGAPEPEPTEPPAATEPPAPEGPKVLNYSFAGGDIPSLDPAVATDTGSIQIVAEAFIGLTYVTPETNATEPGMATSWDSTVNEDGTETLTFHLRDDIPWVRWNGEAVETVKTCDGTADRMVTANDFAYGIQRNLDPANASEYAYVWGFVLKGASEFNNGETTDFSTVGVEVVDDFTINLTFLAPTAYNAQIAGMWIGRPQPKWIIEGDCDGALEARGERWTEPGFYQTYGPYTVSEWIHDSSLTLVKNPFWPGIDAVPVAKIDVINFSMLDPAIQFAEYEAGNLDVSDVPGADLDRVRADPVLSAELAITDIQCTYYYGFNTAAPIVDDVRVRRALSLAVDRQSLIDNVLKGGQKPAPFFTHPTLAGAPTTDSHPDLGIKYDPEAAKAELQGYLDEKGVTADSLDLLLMYNSSAGHQAIAEAVQQMWADTLGINVELASQEFAVFLETRTSDAAPQIYRQGWCSDYPDTNNFLREVMASNGSDNATDAAGNPAGGLHWKNDTYEELVAQASAETDNAKRIELYAQAEDILVNQDAVIIPFYWYTGVEVTKPYVERTFGVGGQEAFEKWDILPH